MPSNLPHPIPDPPPKRPYRGHRPQATPAEKSPPQGGSAALPAPPETPPPSCDNCPYWRKLVEAAPAAENRRASEAVGECRRFPPAIVDPSHLTPSGPICRLPLTFAGVLCGEHPSFPTPR